MPLLKFFLSKGRFGTFISFVTEQAVFFLVGIQTLFITTKENSICFKL
jgi:hypothetical protein